MKLKEKLKEVSESLRNESKRYPRMRTVDVCDALNRLASEEWDDEKIADDFAIGFHKWVYKLTASDCQSLNTKELLEIYKKEKGL